MEREIVQQRIRGQMEEMAKLLGVRNYDGSHWDKYEPKITPKIVRLPLKYTMNGSRD